MVFPNYNIKNEYHHQIPHIRINIGSKLYLKKTILIFWLKFSQKVYIRSKIENVNINTEKYLN